jgi:hypothetical protein
MAHITLAGVLLDPTGEFSVGDKVKFTHQSTTGSTIKSAVSVITVPPNGAYSINLEYGLVLVEYNDYRLGQYRNLGIATVNATNTATSIPELLNALVPVSSAELIQFQAILADAVAAQDAALVSQNAAAASAATLDLINDLSQAYIFDTVAAYQASTIVFPVGKTIHLNDRQADFTVIAGTGTATGYGVIASNQVSNSISLVANGRANIVNFGAVTGGVIPCAMAIQAALDTKMAVYIPFGSFNVESTLYYYQKQEIYGEGDASELKSSISGGNILENAEQVYDCNFHNFRIDGSGLETGGIRINRTYEGHKMSDLYILRVGGRAVWITEGFVITMVNVLVQGGYITEHGIYMDGCTTINLYGCRFRQTKVTGAGATITRSDLESGFASYLINFNGCLFESNMSHGIQMQSAQGCIVENSYFEANNVEYTNNNAARANHIHITDLGNGVADSDSIQIKGNYFNKNYVEHLVYSDLVVRGMQITYGLDQNFGGLPHQITRYKIDLSDSVSRLALTGIPPSNVDSNGNNGRISAADYTATDSTVVRLVYFNATATAIAGDITASITSTRTLQSGNTKTCSFEIDSIDVSALIASGLSSRVIAIIPPVDRISRGPSTGVLNHSGVSASGVLAFYSQLHDTEVWHFIRKQRITPSGNTVGRVSDLSGVTGLDGSLVYF